jgi:xanthine/CO dehydrogenase XdhC/CoxF family maturation factor
MVATAMKELQDIIKGYDKALQNGNRVALATVVYVDGSSYRRPGARMMVTDEGDIIDQWRMPGGRCITKGYAGYAERRQQVGHL